MTAILFKFVVLFVVDEFNRLEQDKVLIDAENNEFIVLVSRLQGMCMALEADTKNLKKLQADVDVENEQLDNEKQKIRETKTVKRIEAKLLKQDKKEEKE